ncbi:kinase-like domain-containing protein [Biscogniauxia mediterranea]|nr:kinase-like domain-containing protein [Biscogniauxia mediterranea]
MFWAAGEENIANLEQELKGFFTDTRRFGYEKSVGNGCFGFGLLFHEKIPGRRNRRFVVKRAMAMQEELKKEKGLLEMLQHAEHIVNLVHLESNPLEPRNGEGGIMGPYIIMEYMENGSLQDFIRRTQRVNIPNRILAWMFLCLTRACVAMAYPPGLNPDGSIQEERVDPSRKPTLLAHYDMTTENIMFGTVDPLSREHSIMPSVKLIDFGASGPRQMPIAVVPKNVNSFDQPLKLHELRTQGDTSYGVHQNLFDIATAMMMIAWHRDFAPEPWCREAIRDLAGQAGMDPELRLLVARCLAADPENRPRLDDLLARLRRLVAETLPAKLGGGSGRESDAAMRDFVQRFVLNAPLMRKGG